MENYAETRERWVWPGILSIRSIGIESMKMNYAARIQTPGDCHWLSRKTSEALVNFMSYYYTAMSIAIPEAFNSQARPVISGDFDYFFNSLDNSNGSAINPPDPAPSPEQESAGAEMFNNGPATADAPPSITGPAQPPLATVGSVSFSTLTDAAHTNTENCFPFLPSVSVQGSPTSVCDCMTTTAPLTVLSSGTSCALSNTVVPINAYRSAPVSLLENTPTAIVTPAPTTSATFSADERYGFLLQHRFSARDPVRANCPQQVLTKTH